MIEKNIKDINKDDIEYLIKNQIPESKTLEYKRSLPSNSNEDKKEFSADVISFANADGGDLIYGIEEENGMPKKIIGFEDRIIDSEKLRLESLIRDGIRPRIIPNIQIQPIKISDNNNVILIRIPKSFTSPHTIGDKTLFYSRNSAGKYQMDVNELKNAFLFSENISEKIKNFRYKRISEIINEDTPIPLKSKDILVLHIIPISSFYSHSLDIDFLKIYRQLEFYIPLLWTNGGGKRFNLDGLLRYDNSYKPSYCQIYRNGIIESAVSNFLFKLEEKNCIPSITYEKEIIEKIKIYSDFLIKLEVLPPFVIFISMLGIKGSFMGVDKRKRAIVNLESFNKDNILLPDILIESKEVLTDCQSIAKKIRPIFNIVWNAYGFPESFNYDEQGNWIGGKFDV